jgi:hypothetical protein
VAVITVDDGSALALDGITVTYQRSYEHVGIAAAVGLAALLASVAVSRTGRSLTTFDL